MKIYDSIINCRTAVATLFLVLIFLALSIFRLEAVTPADEPLVKVVEKTLPAVVIINTERIIQREVQDPFNLFYNRYYNIKQRVASLGSGVLIDPSGYIVTCAHVVGRADDKGAIKITLSDGTILPAKLVDSDEDTDLALLKIEHSAPFPFISLTDLSPNLLGETVVALGDPVGYQSSVSSGILSAKERKIQTENGEVEGLLQTNAAINPGNSGGALVDIEGKLVGICNAKLAAQAVEGIGFAIPAAKVAPWVADAIAVAKGEKKPPQPVSLIDVVWKRFGVRFQNITPDLARAFGLPTTQGMLVSDVEKGSPADDIGMANGMILVRIGNVPILNSDSLPRELSRIKKGDRVAFTMAMIEQRGGLVVSNSKTVELEAR